MPSIFLSYRRSDVPAHAGRLYDRLVGHFGTDNVFMDVDTLEPGEDFVERIQARVARCDVLLAVIGPAWLASDGVGGRRLDDPSDWVRVEIAEALKRQVRVVPVLVAGAAMPPAEDLPEQLRPLSRRHALEMTDSGWSSQVVRL